MEERTATPVNGAASPEMVLETRVHVPGVARESEADTEVGWAPAEGAVTVRSGKFPLVSEACVTAPEAASVKVTVTALATEAAEARSELV